MNTSRIEDYANAPVPEHRTIPGWRIALIVASFSIALPGFLNSAQITMALGLRNALGAALLAGIILCAMGILTSIVSVRSRLTTYLLVQRSFGRHGAIAVNLIIAAVHIGWFGVNMSFFGGAMLAATREIYGVAGSFDLFVLLGGALMAISTIYGFRALDSIALFAVPVLLLIFVTVLVLTVRRHGIVLDVPDVPPVPMTFGIALSALVGANLVTVAAMPDLARYIRSTRQAVVGMVLSFPLATPLLMIMAAIPALSTGETDIFRLIVGFGLGLPALLVLILSTWTINAANLYSTGLSLTATIPSIKQWKFTLLGGAIGALLAMAGIIDAFVPFLLLLGLIIPPIAAIYVIDGFTVFGKGGDRPAENAPAMQWRALVTWIAAAAIALLATRGWFALTTVPALDATLLAAAIYIALGGWRGDLWRQRRVDD